jgi:tetratricopeptide (TPR) repeat protein
MAPAQTDPLTAKSRQAKELMAAGKFGQAIPLYEELCRALPGNPGMLLNLGLAYHGVGNLELAIPHFEAALAGDANNIAALMSLGAARLQTGPADKAIDAFEKVAKLQPANDDARGLLASAYLAGERFTDAAALFRKLTAASPKDAKAWAGLGRTYDALAAKSYEGLAAGSAEWLAVVAHTRMERGQYRSAFYFFQQALAKDAKLRGAHAAMAEIYRKTNHADWAAEAEKKEAALGPADCAKVKAECDFRAGRLLEAASGDSPYWKTRAYNELAQGAYAQLKKLPASVELHAIRAQMYAGRNQQMEAAEQWRAAAKLRPGDAGLQRELAAALFFAKDYKAALPLLEPMLKKEPESAELNFFTGDSLLRLEQPGKAIPYLEAAVRTDANLLPARASLGLALARLDRQADAIGHLEAALAMDDDASLHYALARAYQAAGQADRAKQTMAAYQELRKKLDADKAMLEEQVQITPPR